MDKPKVIVFSRIQLIEKLLFKNDFTKKVSLQKRRGRRQTAIFVWVGCETIVVRGSKVTILVFLGYSLVRLQSGKETLVTAKSVSDIYNGNYRGDFKVQLPRNTLNEAKF